MPLRNFLLSLHVVGVIIGLGPSFAFPFVGALARKPGAPVPWFLRFTELVATRLIDPITATVIPGTGAGLIIISRGAWNPFKSHGRWLLAAIILYVIAFAFSNLVQLPSTKKAIAMADAQQFGPEFGARMKGLARGGQFLSLLVITIAVLMMTKPGSGFIHP